MLRIVVVGILSVIAAVMLLAGDTEPSVVDGSSAGVLLGGVTGHDGPAGPEG